VSERKGSERVAQPGKRSTDRDVTAVVKAAPAGRDGRDRRPRGLVGASNGRTRGVGLERKPSIGVVRRRRGVNISRLGPVVPRLTRSSRNATTTRFGERFFAVG
jgi:hypothetical protein